MSTAQVVVKLRGGPRPMSVVVNPNPGPNAPPSDFTAPFGPDDVVRFSGIPPGRARVEISRHAMPPLLALRTVELKGGETAEIEVVLDTLVDMTGLVVRAQADKTPLEAVAWFKNGKSQSSTLSSDGSFRFRDVPQGPCTVEVRTFDKAQRLLWSHALAEIPAGRLDIEVDVGVEVEPATRPSVEKAPPPAAPRITAAPPPRPSPAKVPMPRPSPAKAPIPRPSPAKTPVVAKPPPAAQPVPAPAAPAPAAVIIAAQPAPEVAAAPAKKGATKSSAAKKEAAPKKETAAKKAPASKKEPAAKKEAVAKKEAAPKKTTAKKEAAPKKAAAPKKKK